MIRNTKKLTTGEFIEKAIIKHGENYDYSKVNYLGSKTTVEIRCKKHDFIFNQTPNCHLKGSGCEKCANERVQEKNSFTNEQFIDKSIKYHGEKFDYSKVEYVNIYKEVEITCKQHQNTFLVTPANHLTIKSGGCQKCNTLVKLTKSEFIRRATEKHGEKYNYSEVEFENVENKIKITCNICGNVFKQNLKHHLNGCGCKKCSNKIRNEKISLSQEEFLQNAKNKHGEKYDYSLTEYKGSHVKIKIICKIHNIIFEQKASSHSILGNGCPMCYTSKGENKIRLFLESKNINYITQKTFNGCKNTNALKFDFYLPDYNILIEYDGEQHFKPVDFFGGEKGFHLTQINDQIKNDYCLTNNIPLIRIKYSDNLIEKLTNELISLQPNIFNN